MKLVVKVRVLPTEEQAVALGATLDTCNAAASWLSAEMHGQRLRRKHEAQSRFYTELHVVAATFHGFDSVVPEWVVSRESAALHAQVLRRSFAV